VTITGALKNATGKPRPDLIARCNPKPGTIDPPVTFPAGGLSNITICTQTDHSILKDGFRSFPSGHSSTAFAGLFYLSLYLAAKLHVMDNKGEVWRTFIVMVPTLGAALIADSRIMDARHHPFDVISGSLLGIVVAWGAYRQYFPSLSQPWLKGRAFPIRSWGKGPLHPDEKREEMLDNAELLRNGKPSDDEAAVGGFSSSSAAGPSVPAGQQENVFRQQISESQRRRRNDFEAVPHQTLADTLGTTNPFASNTRNREEDYWNYSSSEDRDSFELQPQYGYTAPHENNAPVPQGYGADTAYHGSRAASTERQPIPSVNIASQSIANQPSDIPQVPVPPSSTNAALKTEGSAEHTHGVDLTESYARDARPLT
jgi:diacylglycerol diphosphate phosphatase / phosphatidate phosphatase